MQNHAKHRTQTSFDTIAGMYLKRKKKKKRKHKKNVGSGAWRKGQQTKENSP